MKNLLLLFFCLILATAATTQIPSSNRSKLAVKNNETRLKKEFASQNLTWGNDVFIRIFKHTKTLELWVKKGSTFTLFKTYDICKYSGGLGPKKKEGDLKSPEGFYYTTPSLLNPFSQLHLSFNIGYPNKFDRQHGYTGSAIMIHGYCYSIGCYAMTNPSIEEIYTIINGAYQHKQKLIRIHIFPFKMSNYNMALAKRLTPTLYPFWLNLKEGYDYFEQHKNPPNVEVKNKKYIFNSL